LLGLVVTAAAYHDDLVDWLAQALALCPRFAYNDLATMSPSTHAMTVWPSRIVDFETGRCAHHEGPTPGTAAILPAGRLVSGSG
jgi:hypothetical protein